MRAEADGMGRISALLPAARMLAAFRRIDGLAKKAGAPEEEDRDLDRIQPHRQGGETGERNLGPKCHGEK
ncbi:hypothetical protein [Candidatus Frankia alpina]|uniref:hypothetical protein n=1 Tax=Candidatus Frankia alpina TaxID=2699483 RepID=UPI001F354613|nr:hypothetical protein [Candidatus Frankia alpina]